jgi:putative tryptophan/tyrosine transport system substrate-binding protein
MKRREFITLLGGAAAAWPLVARAQQAGKVWRVGFLSGASRSAVSGSYDALVQAMRELGYVEGKDFVIEWRSVEGRYERIPEIAAELVRLKVDVIVTGLSAALPTLKQAHCPCRFRRRSARDPRPLQPRLYSRLGSATQGRGFSAAYRIPVRHE